jgi:hypothetical protein
MVLIALSPNDVLTFDIEDISDAIQSRTAQSCSSTEDDSSSLFEVTSNMPFRYTISPNTGMMQMNDSCITTMELVNSDLGLVVFLSTVPGFFWDRLLFGS